MGKETARELARMGAEVILGCRRKMRGAAAIGWPGGNQGIPLSI
jgi:NAD(P)-dependent dehydrogenase (short-subunit alcohol dehydrogenase family)